MKIGILTYHRSHNYGAFLQSFALAAAIREATGFETEIIDYNSKFSEKYYRREIFSQKKVRSVLYNLKRFNMFKAVVKGLPLSEDKLISDDPDALGAFVKGKYDAIIVGSDEIWKLDGSRGFPNAYWLPGVRECHKFSYAASARNDVRKISLEDMEKIAKLLNDFEIISVRDQITKELIDKAVEVNGQKSMLVCDPTMAYSFKYDKQMGNQLIKERFGIDTAKKTIGIMVDKPAIVRSLIKRYGEKFNFISLYNYVDYTCSDPCLTPFEWYQVIGVLDGLVTTYFHGMCMAINGNTPFLIIERRKIADESFSKSYDLLKRNNAEQFYIQESTCKNVEQCINGFAEQILDGTIEKDFSHVKKAEQQRFYRFVSELKSILSGEK